MQRPQWRATTQCCATLGLLTRLRSCANWDAIKRAEKQSHAEGKTPSLLDTVPRSFPSLLEAGKLGSKAAKVGFDWPDLQGILSKLHEEVGEMEAEIANGSGEATIRLEEELGDVLFTLSNLARHLRLDGELALRRSTAKFRRRFAAMESASREPLDALSPGQLEALWQTVKAHENKTSAEPTNAGQNTGSVAAGRGEFLKL